VDYGQFGRTDGGYAAYPVNPCDDPPVGAGERQTAPWAEGGALRAQSLLRAFGEPVALNGAILRVDPRTGSAFPDNPRAGDPDPNAGRIVAFGLRNPFRFTFRPGTNEVWAVVAGAKLTETIDRIGDSRLEGVPNFGWPCYEGSERQPDYAATSLSLCER